VISLYFIRWQRLGGALAISVALSGCGVLSGAGPFKSTITDVPVDNPPYDLINLSAETIGPYMRPPAPAAVSHVSPTDAIVVRLVPGDVIHVMIADNAKEGAVFAPLATGGTAFEARVDADGRISLPYAGRLKVAGMTLTEVEALVRKNLKGVVTDPQVLVNMVGDLSGSVLVAGAVKQPGRFSALQGPLTLLDAINMAGGPLLEPHLVDVVVRNGKKVETLSYQDVLAGQNMPVSPRSEIIVERARKRFVAMGAVGKPGLHDLPSQNPSLLEALGAVGGLKETSADPKGVFVFRMTTANDGTSPKAEVFQLNMREPQAIFLARQFLVRPEDAIYVTNAAVYEWQKIISPIVQVLLLGRTIEQVNSY